MALGITVVICTYNGSRLLPETIRHIAQQNVSPDISWEVIIIDNASTDNTCSIALAEWQKYSNPAPFRVVKQPKQGITFARKMGVNKARYDFILFCDDDNWLSPNYVALSYEIMLNNPTIGVLGGHGELVYEVPPPSWVSKMSLFGNGAQAEASGKVTRNLVYGAGCVVRKSAYLEIYTFGFKPMLVGRQGKNLTSGEDYEICYSIALIGYDIWYDQRLTFKHFMPKNRQSWDYHIKFFKDGAGSHEVLFPYQFVLNYGCRNLLLFHVRLIRVMLSSVKLFLKLSFEKTLLHPLSDDGKINKLRLIAVKAKIQSSGRYYELKKNFLTILHLKKDFEQNISIKQADNFYKEGRAYSKKIKVLLN
ncbi:glycosyltransferase [Pontibacter ramchanderi]|uniref:Glycosyltransferase involved in cell wall biosynthesis n=1 Tax=Pontibacter ramchanderi TaxID=1179743 RepID=A0A2N3U7R1_9BACT|nr:glycosyltransferase [Pontibacter ramchanderi]PKV62787.1 glycosyltransferase involved in cell wall biosynthesis [Pontibacter ramchanderi]